MKINFRVIFQNPLHKWWLFEFNLFKVEYHSLRWKDKFETPRCEMPPNLIIILCNLIFRFDFGDDEYWERKLWTNKYCNGDKVKAKKTWPWQDRNGKSTW